MIKTTYKLTGRVDSLKELPTGEVELGSIYLVGEINTNKFKEYVFTEDGWKELAYIDEEIIIDDNFKGTKSKDGTFKWIPSGHGFQVLTHDNYHSICETTKKHIPEEERIANAKLIAAAPELLTTLQYILKLAQLKDIRDKDGFLLKWDMWCGRAETLIEKTLN